MEAMDSGWAGMLEGRDIDSSSKMVREIQRDDGLGSTPLFGDVGQGTSMRSLRFDHQQSVMLHVYFAF